MRSIILTLSALALSSSVVFAQTPPAPPPAAGAPTAEQPTAPPPPPPPPPASAEPGAAAPPPPPPNAGAVDDDMVDGPEGGPAMHGKPGGPDHKMMGHGGPRHHMRPGGPRGDRQWRGMRRAQGPEFKIEIDDDGGVKVEVKCGPREEARACADITMELMDRAMN